MSSRVPASPVQLACWDTGYSRPACWSASASTRAARHLWRSAVRESDFRYFKDDQFSSDLFLRFFYLCPCVWLPAVQGWFCSVFPLLLNSFIKKKKLTLDRRDLRESDLCWIWSTASIWWEKRWTEAGRDVALISLGITRQQQGHTRVRMSSGNHRRVCVCVSFNLWIAENCFCLWHKFI